MIELVVLIAAEVFVLAVLTSLARRCCREAVSSFDHPMIVGAMLCDQSLDLGSVRRVLALQTHRLDERLPRRRAVRRRVRSSITRKQHASQHESTHPHL